MAIAQEPDAPLRRGVRLLGALLGPVRGDQGGEGLLAAEESVRRLSLAARESGDLAPVRAAVRALDPERQHEALRAFALYFQLANIAEQHRRLRRRRQYGNEERPARESLDDAFERLAGIPEDEVERRLAPVSLQLVLTAHPTEASRRTILLAHVRISGL